MSGLQEILIIGAILLVILYLPKRTGDGRKGSSKQISSTLPGQIRLGILISLVWLAATAIAFQPWEKDFVRFGVVGIGPVILGWGVLWVIAGFRKRSR